MQYVPYWVAGHIVRGVARVYGKRIAAVGAGVAGYQLYSSSSVKKRSKKMLTPKTVKRPRREGAVEVMPDMGTYTNSRYSQITDRGGYVQRDHERVVVGRPARKLTNVTKQVTATQEHRIDRFQWLTDEGTKTGAYLLGNHETGVAGSRIKYYPVYLFDLTALAMNMGESNNERTISKPFYRLVQQETTTGSYFAHVNVDGKRPDFATSALPATATILTDGYWGYERMPYYLTNYGGNSPLRKALLEWADIRLELVGATTNPCSITVSLVRLHEYVQPRPYEENSTAVDVSRSDTSNESKAVANNFWDQFTGPLITGTPLGKTGNNDAVAEKMQVIWSRKYNFNPTETTESDSTGHSRAVKIFYNMDMLVDYTRPDEDFKNTINTEQKMYTFDPNWYEYTQDNRHCSCYPKNLKSRVFLMIHADNGASYSTVQSNGAVPGFDLMVRRKVVL